MLQFLFTRWYRASDIFSYNSLQNRDMYDQEQISLFAFGSQGFDIKD